MANWCSIAIEITFKDEAGASALNAQIEAATVHAVKNHHDCIFIGCANRYLFSHSSSVYAKDFYLYGEVKWAFGSDDFRDLTSYIRSIAQIQNLSVEYEEGGCALFGRYELNSEGSITHKYLPVSHYPEWSEENSESYYDILLSALDEHGEEEKIHLQKEVFAYA